MSGIIKKWFFLALTLSLVSCQGKLQFDLGQFRGLNGLNIDICEDFGINPCNVNNPQLSVDADMAHIFDTEIYPVLRGSCQACHQVGLNQGFLPLADRNRQIAFKAFLKKLGEQGQTIQNQLLSDHNFGNWDNRLRIDRDSFIVTLNDYQGRICSARPEIPYCAESRILRTDSVRITEVPAASQRFRFNITNLVYPGGLPTGKYQPYAEVGVRQDNGQVVFDEFRVFSPSDNLTLSEVFVEVIFRGQLIPRRSASVNIGVNQAITQTPPPDQLPGNPLLPLIDAPVTAQDVTTYSLDFNLRFGNILLGLPGSQAPLTARQRFDQQVVPILQLRCMGCHGVNPPAGGYAMFPADLNTRYMNSRNRITPRNYDGSLLIVKGTNSANNHGGGNALNNLSNSDSSALELWINAEQ